jgi:hypothetical protein
MLSKRFSLLSRSIVVFAAAASGLAWPGCGEDAAPDDNTQEGAGAGDGGAQGDGDDAGNVSGGSASGGAAGGGSASGGAAGGGSASGGAAGGGSASGGAAGGGSAGGSRPDGGAGGGNAGGAGADSGTTGGAGPDGGSTSDAGTGGGTGGGGTKARFSFFMTSQAGLGRLAGDPDGFGGDLRFGKPDGLSGADEICKQLAEASMPGNGKTWRAFLSVTKGPDGNQVNAIDRIGEGPWYDRRERLFAMNKAALMNTRPLGADPVIIDDFPNEDGVPNHDPGTGIIDNHNTLTGSSKMGTLASGGLAATCQDWTSSKAEGGKPQCGVSWPRSFIEHWISALREGGCAPGATAPGAEAGTPGTVGALGGYGAFYCFALTP